MAKRTISLKKASLFWKKYNGDSVDEDEEEEDILSGCQTLNKRPKWMTSAYPSTVNMASNDVNLAHSSGGSKTNMLAVKVPIRKSFHHRLKPEIKENGAEAIEVIDLESNNGSSVSPVDARPPLIDLSVRPKTKKQQLVADVTYPGSSSRPCHRNHIHERRQNGVHPSLMNTFTSSLRMSKSPVSSLLEETTLNETFKIDEKKKYSELLKEYQKSLSTKSETPKQRKFWTQSSLNSKPKAASSSRPMETIDLTIEKKRTYIKAKPYQSPVLSSDDEEVKIFEERPIGRVNSLEKKLSHNSLVSTQWLMDIQQKYSEKERERLRQVEEEKLKKDLYSGHNQSRRMEALDARIRNHLKITDIVLDDTEGVQLLPEITPQMNEKINAALKPNPSSEVLVEGFSQRITRKDIQTLNRLNWLNDEVINFYLNLIIERGKKDKNMNVYAFNTFFYPKLVSGGYNSLKRWTKKVDIFDNELLLVPIHLGMHWCMATIDFRDHTVRYYDSMGSDNNRCLKALLQYLNDESLDKKKKEYDISNWTTKNVKEIPQQMNGSDCGMFSCMFAEYLSRNARISFSQSDMPYFRRKMVYEIISKTLLQ
uniref:Ubiquitin-like protease family profile domain-containing protein n=1 Tax=Graphocephala atropunctata TaxID=36148 RepID=A0A1B6KPG0_9HEMI